MSLIFVDCEAAGGCPRTGVLTEFGAVEYKSRKSFHGKIWESELSKINPAIPHPVKKLRDEKEVFAEFAEWLKQFPGRPIFVSDNPAYDYQWINDGFWTTLGYNPFGHSARRLSDYYAGLIGDFFTAQKWKHLRITPHTHHPVDDAMGNVEAFERLQRGER
jgi:hypothetical protein